MISFVLFSLFVLALLALDLGVFRRGGGELSFRQAVLFSAGWIGVALCFNLGLYLWSGAEAGLAFLTGYLIEKALSVDNLFVFLVIFSYFRVPVVHQQRILFWGILSALVLRGLLIFAGVTLIERFHWTLYLMGGFLVFTAYRMLAGGEDEEFQPEGNPVLLFLQRHLPLSRADRKGRFLVWEEGRLKATPLLVVLLFVEVTDLVFAFDSIPAILAISTDSFVVFSSNILAILGLRALYFALAGFLDRLRFLNCGLGVVLGFVGVKMLLADLVHIPIGLSLGVVVVVLSVTVAVSLLPPDHQLLRYPGRMLRKLGG